MKAFEKFLNKYEATAEIDEYRRYSVRQPLSFNYYDVNISSYQATFNTEPMIKMHVPQHQFVRLTEQDKFVEYLERTNDYNQQVVNMLREDERVRDANPVVQKAYRNYLMLLELARK